MAIHSRIPPAAGNPLNLTFDQPIPLPPLLVPALGRAEAPRSLVEQIIEQLIDSLDANDGDPDLEDSDPDADHDGREEEWPCIPRYGIDQTRDPINQKEMKRQSDEAEDRRYQIEYDRMIARHRAYRG